MTPQQEDKHLINGTNMWDDKSETQEEDSPLVANNEQEDQPHKSSLTDIRKTETQNEQSEIQQKCSLQKSPYSESQINIPAESPGPRKEVY